jgi:hypothetical protein
MADLGRLESRGHRIEINCPHIENGTCADCLWPQVMPYVAARQTLDDLLPKLKLLSDALTEHAKQGRQLAKGTAALRGWIEKAAALKWELGEAKPTDEEPTP